MSAGEVVLPSAATSMRWPYSLRLTRNGEIEIEWHDCRRTKLTPDEAAQLVEDLQHQIDRHRAIQQVQDQISDAVMWTGTDL